MKKIKILIVDDHKVVRQGLRGFLELQDDMEVCAEAADGNEAVALVDQATPDIVLMDLVMPNLDGIEATRQIKCAHPGIGVIALTSFTEDEKVFPAIQAGAASYLLKDVSPDDLAEAIRAVHRGETRLHPKVAKKLVEQVKKPRTIEAGRGAGLTEREIDVIKLVAEGMTNQGIAERLVISEKTVKTHVSNILAKLNLQDRTQLAIYAIKNDLVDKP